MNSLLQSKGTKPRKGKIKNCFTCGVEMYCYPGEMRKFCSYACRDAQKPAQVTRTCKNCKQKYSTFRSQIAHRGSNFCGNECRYSFIRNQNARPEKVKIKRELRSGVLRGVDNMFSQMVRKRDKCCLRCGSTKNLECSHIIIRQYKSVRWDFDNAKTLCHDCHHWWGTHPKQAKEWLEILRPGLYFAVQQRSLDVTKVNPVDIRKSLKAEQPYLFAPAYLPPVLV